MTWLSVLGLLRKIPGIVWAFLFLFALGVAGSVFLYQSGRRAGEVAVRTQALQDSADTAMRRLEQATRETEQARKTAQNNTRLSDSGRVIRSRIRESAVPFLDSLPAPVIRLIEADDAQIARDSMTIATYVAVDTAWRAERWARIGLDTIEAHQRKLAVEPTHTRHRRLAFLAGAATVGLLVVGFHLVAR